jgi:hypothetical protein
MQLRLLILATLTGGLLATLSPAAEPAADPATAPAPATKGPPTDDEIRMQGIFNSALPRTEKKNSLRLIVHPHIGDLSNNDYIRTDLGVRYGITSRWEATAEAETYFSHGLGSQKFFEEAGFSGYHLGTKYALRDPFHIGWEASVGVDLLQPTGSPPVDVTDGLRHVAPFITFSHQMEKHPAWRVFWGVGYDDVTKTNVVGELTKNELGGDAVNASAGFLYERGTFTYTLETTYATMRPISDIDRDVFTIRPGIVWVIPQRFTFGAKGKWLLGFGLRASHGPDGYDYGASAKLRVNFDFKKLLGLKKSAAQVK